MSELVVVALINATVTGLGSFLAYLGLRHRVDKTGQEVGSKVEETRAVNLTQIETSNNFNQKLEKIHQGQTFLIRKVDRIERDVRTLSEQTGIHIGE